MFDYDISIVNKLRDIPFVAQGGVGNSPSQWAREMGIDHEFNLPNNVLTREQVYRICQESQEPILKAYLIVMAWGAQGRGRGGKKHVQHAWRHRGNIEERIQQLRERNLSREEAYNLFININKIPGLGPAYFTKLLYFFSANRNMYIMDQWTTKPVLLLTRKHIIRHTKDGPTDKNTGKNYELFCRVIDDLVQHVDANSGDEVEQRLFSVGSINSQPRGEFRQFIYDRWNSRDRLPRYSQRLVDQLSLNNQND